MIPWDEFLDSGAIMSLPDDHLLIGWGTPRFAEARRLDLVTPAFYFPDFFLTSETPWIQYPSYIQIGCAAFLHQVQKTETFACEWKIAQPEQFNRAFSTLMGQLQKGILDKGVPYAFAESTACMSPARLRSCLFSGGSAAMQRAGYLYGYWTGGAGVLGVTPELLFSHSKQMPQLVQTMALAGTCPAKSPRGDLINSVKDRHEHQIVVEGICQALERLGSVHVGSLQLLELPKLSHLMTPIELVLNNDFHFEELVRSLHPTPALGAFPRERGRQWLQAFQRHTPRQFYGTPVGFRLPCGSHRCLVAIRNVQWNDAGMRIGAGCGVVAQSVFEQEWQEIQLKIQSIRELLSL